MANRTPHLTNKEYAIMKVLWDSDKGLIASEISALANINENSCKSMLNKLLSKEFIKVDGSVKVAKTNSRLFIANITLSEYAALQLESLYADNKKTFDIGSIVYHMVNNRIKEDSNNDITNKLKKIVSDYENDKSND